MNYAINDNGWALVLDESRTCIVPVGGRRVAPEAFVGTGSRGRSAESSRFDDHASCVISIILTSFNLARNTSSAEDIFC